MEGLSGPQAEDGQDAQQEAELIVRSSRPGKVFVNGRPRGNVEPQKPLSLMVEPGPQVVSVRPAEGAEVFRRVRAAKAKPRQLRFDFEEAASTLDPEADDPAGEGTDPGGDTDNDDGASEPDGGSSVADAPDADGRKKRPPRERGAEDTADREANGAAASQEDVPDDVPEDAPDDEAPSPDAPDPEEEPQPERGPPSGRVVITGSDRVYRGNARDGVPHGRGTMEWTDGAVYSGQWQEGTRHGSGEYIWPDGARYVGEWDSGVREGIGAMEWADGTYYEGAWEENAPNGTGLMEWPDGSRYEGEFADGRPHGLGVYTAPDGLQYEGEFRNGRATGGVLTVTTGQQYWATMNEEGDWRRHGPVEENE
jgi:hypothetical protein